MALTREQFLAKGRARRYRDVPLSDGDSVRIQSLTERERSEFEQSQLIDDGTGRRKLSPERIREARARLIVLCLVDDEGGRLLGDDDLQTVLESDGLMTGELYDEIQDHLGYKRGELEDRAKN